MNEPTGLVMGKLKSQSASQMRMVFPRLARLYRNERIIWPPGHFVSGVDVDETTIKIMSSIKDARIQVSFN